MLAYVWWLLLISGLAFGLERLWPARPEQAWLRPRLWSDGLHLVFNGHFLGASLYVIGQRWLGPWLDAGLGRLGLSEVLYRSAAQSWPLWVQVVVAVLVMDLMQWGIHRLLHAVPALWRVHQVHHSVVDGEMDWIVAFRFSWLEIVVYKALQYAPLAWFGFAGEAVMVHAVFGTLIGHLNHANLRWDYGPLAYVLNSPKMHMWHHDYDSPGRGRNFGIIFSCWDWMFGTAYLPAEPPRALGFPGVERVPRDFFAQEVWPLGGRLPGLVASGLGLGLVIGLYWLG